MTATEKARIRATKPGSRHNIDTSLRQGSDKHTFFFIARLRGHTNEHSVRRVQRSASLEGHILSVSLCTTRRAPTLACEEWLLVRSDRSKHLGDQLVARYSEGPALLQNCDWKLAIFRVSTRPSIIRSNALLHVDSHSLKLSKLFH